MNWCRLIVASVVLSMAASLASAQSGVLIPANATQPDASVLSLEEMTVNITIDDGDARVFITQIFSNHTERLEEGNYIFALPTGSTVSDFAVWDGPVRIPAVILERRRAEELYTQLRNQAIDPGLLQAGERDGSDPKAESTFSASIAPIPPYSTKRLELEYHQRLPVDRLAQHFTLPLAPAQYGRQTVAHFRLQITLHSTLAMNDLHARKQTLPTHVDAAGCSYCCRRFRSGQSLAQRRLHRDVEAGCCAGPTRLPLRPSAIRRLRFLLRRRLRPHLIPHSRASSLRRRCLRQLRRLFRTRANAMSSFSSTIRSLCSGTSWSGVTARSKLRC